MSKSLHFKRHVGFAQEAMWLGSRRLGYARST